MRITDFSDAPSITAQYLIGERQRMAARESVLAPAGRDRRHRRVYLGGMGRMLVRLGAWLQAVARQPVAMEETV